MITHDELLRSLANLDAAELDRWIERHWVRPEGSPGVYAFRGIDVARTRLVAELRELEIGDEALPLVLSLLDQLYAVRRSIRLLQEAIRTQPEEVQQALLVAVRTRVSAAADGNGGSPPPG